MTAAQAFIGFGEVIHRRRRPAVNAFRYPTYFLMLPMRSLASPSSQGGGAGLAPSTQCGVRFNRFGLISFFDRDHGDGRGPQQGGALAWLDELLASQGVNDADGEVWLQCYPRVLGYTFKPVSFWHCHRGDGSLAAIVVEVNNTFGERHCYLLNGPDLAPGRELRATKVFHVSPFCNIEGGYRFRFMRAHRGQGEKVVARIDYFDAASQEQALIETSVSGELVPATAQAVRRAFFGMPFMTLGVIARIHWQALKLWAKRVQFWRKPALPAEFVTR
jgi:DUF1365 family protein